MSFVILFLLNKYLVTHIKDISRYLESYNFAKENKKLKLEKQTFSKADTELTILVDSINHFSDNYKKSNKQRDEASEALKTLNKNLEGEISSRVEIITRQNEIISHTTKLQEIGKLAGNLAHEINNPLGIITGYAGILVKDDEGNVKLGKDRRTKYLKAIESNVARIKNTITGMLRLSYKNPNTDLEEDDLKQVIYDIVNISKLNSQNNHIRIILPDEFPEIKSTFSRHNRISDANLLD